MTGRPGTAEGVDGKPPELREPAARAVVATLFSAFVIAGWWGVDFGVHWDEHVIVHAWKATVEQAAYVPPPFYPALYYDLSLPALGLAALERRDAGELLEYVGSMPFRLVVRCWMVVFVALAIPITYWGTRRLRGHAVDGLVAAAALAGCWQLSYHARFIATDGLVAVLAPAATWLSLEAWRRPARAGRLLLAAGTMAGLATAAKYPGGVGLLPALWVALRVDGDRFGWRPRAVRASAVGAAYVVAFVLGNAKVLLDAGQVWAEIVAQKAAYEHGHLGHSVEPGLEHAFSNAAYLLHALSPFAVVAMLFAGLAIVGATRAAKPPREELWIFLMVPLVYLVYWSSLRVMIARNLLVVLPYLMVLVGLGAGHLLRSARSRALRAAFMIVLLAALAANLADTVRAAATIPGFETSRAVERLAREIEAHPDETFVVTRELASRMAAGPVRPGGSNWSTLGPGSPVATDARVAVLSSQFSVMEHWWPANAVGRYVDLGPRDVDWDYYPGWLASDRVVLMTGAVFDEVRRPRGAQWQPPARGAPPPPDRPN